MTSLSLRRLTKKFGNVTAVVLHDVTGAPSSFEIKMRDGSVLQATAIRIGKDQITMELPLAGQCQMPAHEVAEINQERLRVEGSVREATN